MQKAEPFFDRLMLVGESREHVHAEEAQDREDRPDPPALEDEEDVRAPDSGGMRSTSRGGRGRQGG